MKKLIIGLLVISGLNANSAYLQDIGGSCPAIGDYTSPGVADKWSFFKCQCTSYVAWKMNKNGIKFNNYGMDVDGVYQRIQNYTSHEQGILNKFSHAFNWDNAVATINVPYDDKPRVGDIAVWEKGRSPVGHVAYVESVNNNIVKVSEYNYNGKLKYYNNRIFDISKIYNSYSNDKANHYIHVNNTLSLQDFWIKTGTIYTNSKFDAQFKLKNNSSESIEVSAIALSLHDSNNHFVKDMKREDGVYIEPGKSYYTEFTEVDTPAIAGKYLVVAKYKDDNANWIELASQEITLIDNPNIDSGISILDGAGSIINPNKICWGCDHDEADMQVHDIPSTIVFQWQATNTCPYLSLGVIDNKTNNVSNIELDVVIHEKEWSSDIASSYETTLPITVDKKANWNTVSVTSQYSLNKKQKIVAYCSNYKEYISNKTTINSKRVVLEGGYQWAGNSSIIRRDNPVSTQSDGVYRDVAIGLSSNSAITLFQWQPNNNCTSLTLKSGFYEKNFNAIVDSVDIKEWSKENWIKKQCNGKLPCTLDAPSIESYYIIRVKTNANALNKNYIHAICE